MDFSVVLIARNEEKTLPRLLGSLGEFMARGGEVVLVDTGSTDGTSGLARRNGCVVHEVGDRFRITVDRETADAVNGATVADGEEPVVRPGDTLFDYAAARNHAATLASNDMVATPDCDEAYTALDLDRIEALIAEGKDQFEYDFVFSHDAQGRPRVQFLHSKFYDRTKMRWRGVVHEVLVGRSNRARLGPDVIKLEHFQNHETDRSGYLRGLALDVFRDPQNDRNSHYLGRELLWTGRPLSAIRELSRHVAMMKWPAERSRSHVHIGDAYAALGDDKRAVRAWQDALNVDATSRAPLMRLSEHYAKKADPRRAAAYAKAAMEIPYTGFYADDMAEYQNKPHDILAWAYHQVGEHGAAVIHEAASAAFSGQSLPTVSILVPTLGRREGLARLLRSVSGLDYPPEKVEVIIEGGPATVPQKVEAMRGRATGDVLCYAANDMEFEPGAVRSAVETMRRTGKGLVAFNGGEVLPDEGNICEHFAISRELADKLGGIFDTDFHHVGVDNLLWARAKRMGQAARDENARVVHHHFSRGAELDDVYKRGWREAEADRALLREKLNTLGV